MTILRALGTMSGTSLDGVDAAELWTDGIAIDRFGKGRTIPYDDTDRAILRAALGRWPGDPGVADAAEVVETQAARLLARFDRPDLVGFHGQTLAHDPEGRRTHQAGDGALLAELLGCPVVWDFRSADVRLGGEGAPLAPIFHHACARWIGADAPLAFLNLGGVGNLTWIDPAVDPDRDAAGALLAFDTGPANAPINDICADWLGKPFDEDGALACEGRARPDLVEALLRHRYFGRIPPKSLDRDAFRAAGAAIDALRPAHAAATWVAVIAATVAQGLTHCPSRPARVLVTGGGRRNPAIMDALAAALPCAVAPVEEVGLDGDLLEAQAFAYLAVRVLNGLATSYPTTTGVRAQVGGGTVSRPAGAFAPTGTGGRHHRTRGLDRAR